MLADSTKLLRSIHAAWAECLVGQDVGHTGKINGVTEGADVGRRRRIVTSSVLKWWGATMQASKASVHADTQAEVATERPIGNRYRSNRSVAQLLHRRLAGMNPPRARSPLECVRACVF